jgi:hypothetical protein
MRGGPDVIGLRISGLAKTPDGIKEIGRPPNKQSDHEEVDVPDEVVDLDTVFRTNQR